MLPRVSAGTPCPHTSRLEHLREHLSDDAAGPGHVGPVCSVDADRYVCEAMCLLGEPTFGTQLLCKAECFPLLLPDRLVNIAEPASFHLRRHGETRVVSGLL